MLLSVRTHPRLTRLVTLSARPPIPLLLPTFRSLSDSTLSTHLQEVDSRDARAYAEEIGALFLETSAKANKNVQELFADISRRLPAAAEPAFQEGGLRLDDNQQGGGGGGGGRAGGGGGSKGGCC